MGSTNAKSRLPEWLVPAIALAALIVFTIAIEMYKYGRSTFIKPENLINVVNQWSFVGIIALGMTLVVTLGGIDLSVGSLVAALGGLGVLHLNHMTARGDADAPAILLTAILMVLLGSLAGAINGVLVTKGRIAPFIATLGGLAAYRSISLALAEGGEYRPISRLGFSSLGRGIAIPGTNVVPNAVIAVPLTIPYAVIVFVLLCVVTWILLNRTRLGRYITAVGANSQAALYSGINIDWIKILTYTLLGVCTGISALLLTARLNSVSSSSTGLLYELDAIAAVAIGGTRMRGGSGTIVGTVIGVLILGVVGNMLNLLQVSTYWQGAVKGGIIIAAALLQRAEEY